VVTLDPLDEAVHGLRVLWVFKRPCSNPMSELIADIRPYEGMWVSKGMGILWEGEAGARRCNDPEAGVVYRTNMT